VLDFSRRRAWDIISIGHLGRSSSRGEVNNHIGLHLSWLGFQREDYRGQSAFQSCAGSPQGHKYPQILSSFYELIMNLLRNLYAFVFNLRLSPNPLLATVPVNIREAMIERELETHRRLLKQHGLRL
jgi:hypothetical protein